MLDTLGPAPTRKWESSNPGAHTCKHIRSPHPETHPHKELRKLRPWICTLEQIINSTSRYMFEDTNQKSHILANNARKHQRSNKLGRAPSNSSGYSCLGCTSMNSSKTSHPRTGILKQITEFTSWENTLKHTSPFSLVHLPENRSESSPHIPSHALMIREFTFWDALQQPD